MLQITYSLILIFPFIAEISLWGYDNNDRNGIALTDWMEDHDYYLIYDAKDKHSFNSSRWNRGYNPDLCFVSRDTSYKPIPIKREIMGDFPRSQHRPMLLTFFNPIDFVSCYKPRWNFKKANWLQFGNKIDSDIRWIPPSHDNHSRFVGVIEAAAKKIIPRGFRENYVPA